MSQITTEIMWITGARVSKALELPTDGYLVRKKSGGNGVVLHREAWYRESFADAEKLFARILKEKTNPNRKSKRKYLVVPSERIEAGNGKESANA